MQRGDLKCHAHLEWINFDPIDLVVCRTHGQILEFQIDFIQRLSGACQGSKNIFGIFLGDTIDTLHRTADILKDF